MTCQGLVVLIVLGVSFVAGTTTEVDPAKSVTCTATAAYVRGTARVTCHFSSDVSSLVPVSLSVDFYPKGQNNPVSVVECIWEADHDGCQMKMGRFSFSRSPSAGPGDMVLEIDDVTDADAGRYVCQQMSAKRSRTPSWPCVLSVEADHPQPIRPEQPTTGVADRDLAVSTQSADRPGEGVSKGSGATEGREAVEDGLDMTILLSTVLGTAAVLVILLLVACLVLRKRRQSQRKGKETKSDEEEPLPASDMTKNPQYNAPDTTENPQDEALDSTENPQDEALDSTENLDPQEDENSTGEGEVSAGVDKECFEMEIKCKAAAMQVPIHRKMSHGEYPWGDAGKRV